MTDKTDKTQASSLPGDAEREASLERAREWHRKKAEEEANGPSIEEKVMEQAKEQRQIQGSSVVSDAWRKAKAEKLLLPPNVPAERYTGAAEIDVALREFKVERDDNRPLQFQGYLIGWNEVDFSTVPRGTQVSIYVTKGNKIVTAVHQWQRGEKDERQRYKAGAHQTPETALEWLIEDGGGKLGRASREAWEAACSLWPSLQGHEVEVID